MSTNELLDRTAVVTGAGQARGIGRAIAIELVRSGANVVLTDMAGIDSEPNVKSQFGSDADRVAYFEADVTKMSDAEAAVAFAVRRFGGLDVMVNNAGVGRGSSDFLELTETDWALSIDVNLRGVANFCQAAIPELRKSDSASIINVASLSGLKAILLIPACYTASKFAVVGMTKQLALQMATESIRVNAICPGSVRTDMMQKVMEDIAEAEGISVEEAEAHEAATIALNRAAEPSEIGRVAAFLAGPASSYVTGEAITVSGGMFSGI